LTRAFAAAVAGDSAACERALAAALRAGLSPAAAVESFRMVHLFAGFPRNLTALEALRAALPVPAKGKSTKGADSRRNTSRRATGRARRSAGRAVFAAIYGPQARAVRAYLTDLDPDVASWIEGHAYARVLSRPGLSVRVRELLAVAALAATAQEKQLASHVRGALRCGATAADVARALAGAAPFVRPGLLPRLRALARDASKRA
jgi:4-carboxymuconolactone decarboxylase